MKKKRFCFDVTDTLIKILFGIFNIGHDQSSQKDWYFIGLSSIAERLDISQVNCLGCLSRMSSYSNYKIVERL